MGEFLILKGRKGIQDLINNQKLKHLIEEVHLSKTQIQTIDLCIKNGVRYQIKEKSYFWKFETKKKYKYVVAFIRKKKDLDLDSLIKICSSRERSLILILDHLQDPFNVGAILRTCCAFGVDGVILSKNKSAPLNHEVTLKSSQGYSLNINTVEVSNLNNAVTKLKNRGYWIYSTEIGHNTKSFKEVEYSNKCVLIMGSEGKGVSKMLRDNSDVKVHIPMKNNVNSLNVSVAAGIIISEITSR
ncbi:RNA methyltransferase TrmH group 3 [Mycoplasma haemocanis str. Illinois]|uniref:RNA methyltransferase TrmH group 3 n=1 Tax=Mycoplasma haemocanis (strain Illinois) TaxID=1111676 RepID=H6N5X2_MYCHN|nr:23S rRNA (guanosine(2251)-2'-O)-methyltransferase RlmB [Mycoplasma haemocanis]AEW44887.1 RNA methyltransferase TrmH group 3 [Mycoplasma haemocanis str. Illinois]